MFDPWAPDTRTCDKTSFKKLCDNTETHQAKNYLDLTPNAHNLFTSKCAAATREN